MRKFVAILLTVIASISLLSACGGGSPSIVKNSNSLIGDWHQTNIGLAGVRMEALISNGEIKINMQMGDVTSIFWLGTFESDKNANELFKTISVGDQNALSMSIFGSMEKTKPFEYRNGDLSFEFSMMGSSTIVHMSK